MPSGGDIIQRQLSEYLQCELYHLLGAYGIAEWRLDSLGSQMRDEAMRRQDRESEPGEEGLGSAALADLVELAKSYNHKLGWFRYASTPWDRSNMAPHGEDEPDRWPAREPLPESLPLTDVKRFAIGPSGDSVKTSRSHPWVNEEEWNRIPRFYNEAIEALEFFKAQGEPSSEDRGERKGSGPVDRRTKDRHNKLGFARSLVTPRDGASEPRGRRAREERLHLRTERYTDRCDTAFARIGPDVGDSREHDAEDLKHDSNFLDEIVGDDLTDGDGSLPIFVLRVHAEAHLAMHAVEAWRSMCLGEYAHVANRDAREWLNRELDRSAALSTFAYCISRTAPWLFAKSEEERKTVFEDVRGAWENLVPTRCMWIASQVCLLSLHRRAYAHGLKPNGANDAYNDYHKLHQLIRDAERRVRAAPVRVEGALEFLAGLDAEAHHHIGELYRSEHAHKPALQHFKAASHRLEMLRRDGAAREVLANSRWNVELHISHGKACYEMGRHKEALSWHLKAWHAFLEMISSETNTGVNTGDITCAIEWLESVRFEPELRKSEISERLRPVVDQLDRISTVGRHGALAAEILLRLGHLLFVLNLGYDAEEVQEAKRQERETAALVHTPDAGDVTERDHRLARERVRRTLGFACLRKAADCDPYSTLVGADLLKSRFRFNRWWEGCLPKAYDESLEVGTLEPIDKQWPGGGDDFERVARVAEYLMLNARWDRFSGETASSDSTEGEALARDLMLDLFMSTDSINVRESQIHRFLMKERLPDGAPLRHDSPAIEFICMRRYSSPFPLLPRPSAFRALGGGYFLRLHQNDSKQPTPYGVVVDPGVDFVENLYRSGYSLGDIDMVVITHDHVDHLGGLDPLLSLLHVRSQILFQQHKSSQGVPDKDKVRILTSASVTDRYEKVRQLKHSNSSFRFINFESLTNAKTGIVTARSFGARFPKAFEIVAMSSVAGTEDETIGGHRDLSEKPSHGICVRTRGGKGASVAMTSDTPPPPPREQKERYARWRSVWRPALEADVLVAHLSSVPLTELRQMDRSEAEGEDRDDADLLIRLQGKLEDADPSLRGQIEYAHWLRSHEPKDRDGNPTEEVKNAQLVGPVEEPWLPPPEHNFLKGILSWAREYTRRWPEAPSRAPQGLFVVGELSEELGTMRGKVSTRLNQHVFSARKRRKRRRRLSLESAESSGFPYALTADIGLHICVARDEKMHPRVEVLCTTCNLDSDRSSQERYHPAHDVYEVCVKGENEGIFYNCIEHDPARQDEPTFLERLERFDIFGR